MRAWVEGLSKCTAAFCKRLLDDALGAGAVAQRAERAVDVHRGGAHPRPALFQQGTDTRIGEREERKLLARARIKLAQEATLWRIERGRPFRFVVRPVPRLKPTSTAKRP